MERQYTVEELAMAVSAVADAGTSLQEASRTYKIPYGTLRRRVMAGTSEYHVCPGTKPALGAEAEKYLLDIIIKFKERRFGLTRREVSSHCLCVSVQCSIVYSISNALICDCRS
jgi:hypothetical protein